VPSVALKLVLGAEMADELILGGQRVLPTVLESRGYAFAHTELEEALRSVLALNG
jgi:NAD dependent epimerase/dehydratase family enzyme